MDRHSYLIAVGGGGVLDAIGLAAALTHRGLRLIRLPTTTLAQCDAGLGVKNAVNAFGQKNFLGTFAPPWAVVNDSSFLPLQDDRSWRAGAAEAFKVAIIKDAGFLTWLCAQASQVRARDLATLEVLIERCARLHLDHIGGSGDPFERGSSRPLDFGHWSAHRLEVLSWHRLMHGEAVAIGIALDLCYARRSGWIADEAVDLVLRALTACGFRLWDEALEQLEADGSRSVLAGLEHFRIHLGGRLSLAMPDGLGRCQDIHALDGGRFAEALADLQRFIRSQ